MKQRTFIALASLWLLSTPPLIHADPLAFTNPFSSKNKSSTPSSYDPVYFGAALGISTPDSFCEGSNVCDDSDSGWKLFAGYEFSEKIAFEVGYVSLGKMQTSTKSTKVAGFELAATGNMSLNDKVGLFAKGGMFRWDAKNNSGKRSSIDVMFGGGINYKLSDSTSLRGEWERFNDIETQPSETSDIDYISIGLTHKTL